MPTKKNYFNITNTHKNKKTLKGMRSRSTDSIYLAGDYHNYFFYLVKFTPKQAFIYQPINPASIKIHNKSDSKELSEILHQHKWNTIPVNYKVAFITSYHWGSDSLTDNKYKLKLQKLTSKNQHKKLYTHIIPEISNNKRDVSSMIGEYIVMELDNSTKTTNTSKNQYLAIGYDGIHKFEMPNKDKLVYASQGSANKSGSQKPFLIGKKYSYKMNDYSNIPFTYLPNEVMEKYHIIDPHFVQIIRNKLYIVKPKSKSFLGIKYIGSDKKLMDEDINIIQKLKVEKY